MKKEAPFELYPYLKIRGVTYNTPPSVSPNVFCSVQIASVVAEWLVATVGEEGTRGWWKYTRWGKGTSPRPLVWACLTQGSS